MKDFSDRFLDLLSEEARLHPRRRIHRNVHADYADPCQRLFNAIEPGSYIQPHRHLSCAREELLVALRGRLGLVRFDDAGTVIDTRVLEPGARTPGSAAAVELQPENWHTIVALEPASVLLEVKAGPFDPLQPKDLAQWAPSAGAAEALAYLGWLHTLFTTQAISRPTA